MVPLEVDDILVETLMAMSQRIDLKWSIGESQFEFSSYVWLDIV